MRLAFAGFVLVSICWLAGVLVCLAAIARRTELGDGLGGLSLPGVFVIATIGVAASNLVI